MPVDHHLVAGTMGGLVSTVALYPLELLKMRMQVTDGSSTAYTSMRGAVRSVLGNEGVRGLYKGITPGVIAATGSWGGYFYFYEMSKRRKLAAMAADPAASSPSLGVPEHMLSGIEAGSIMVLIFNPLWLIKTRLALQDAKGLHAAGPTSRPAYGGMVDALQTILREEGPRGLYKGLVPALFLTSHGAVQFAVYERMKVDAQRLLGSPVGEQPPWVSIALGGISKVVAASVTYPYQVVKSRLQQRGELTAYRYSGVLDCVARTAKEEGVRGFFRGLLPTALRVAPASALTFVVYEETLKMMK